MNSSGQMHHHVGLKLNNTSWEQVKHKQHIRPGSCLLSAPQNAATCPWTTCTEICVRAQEGLQVGRVFSQQDPRPTLPPHWEIASSGTAPSDGRAAQTWLFPGSWMIGSLPSRQQKSGAAPGENGFPPGSYFLRHLSPLPVCEEQVMTARRCCEPGGITAAQKHVFSLRNIHAVGLN